MTGLLVAAALVAVGLVVVICAAAALRRRSREGRPGALLEVDLGGGRPLRSARYRLAGRPDELRQAADGTWIPVELKHRPRPERGPFYSHTVQVWAYCLLVEETTGRPPSYGILRYTDAEVRVPWDGAARGELLELRSRAIARYDGRADPTPRKCAGCVWTSVCDASQAPAALRRRAAGTSTPR